MKSRLARHESRVAVKQTWLMLAAVVIIIVVILRFGIPLLVKLALVLGDVRDSTQKVESSDAVPPVAPRLLALPVATYSAQIKVLGFAESGSKVAVYVNSVPRGEVVVRNEGDFEIDRVPLTSGKNGVWATAVDLAGNKSQDSEVVYVEMDDVKPELTIESPSGAATTADATIEVKGKVSETEAEVTVNNRFINVSSSGSFTTKVSLNVGENKIVVIAKDRAGNQVSTELLVTRQE